jgi:hypothetical protein
LGKYQISHPQVENNTSVVANLVFGKDYYFLVDRRAILLNPKAMTGAARWSNLTYSCIYLFLDVEPIYITQKMLNVRPLQPLLASTATIIGSSSFRTERFNFLIHSYACICMWPSLLLLSRTHFSLFALFPLNLIGRLYVIDSV